MHGLPNLGFPHLEWGLSCIEPPNLGLPYLEWGLTCIELPNLGLPRLEWGLTTLLDKLIDSDRLQPLPVFLFYVREQCEYE